MLGSIPVVVGTPITGDGYEYVELEDGEIHHSDDFGDSYDPTLPVNIAAELREGSGPIGPCRTPAQDRCPAGRRRSAPARPSEAGQVVDFIVANDNNGLFAVQPAVLPDGTLTFTPAPGATRHRHRYRAPSRQRRHRRRRRGHQRCADLLDHPRRRHAATVAGRYIFYNRSSFDGADPAATAGDDAAIALDKLALLPGQAATFDSVTTYSRGINGVMIDVAGLPAGPGPRRRTSC